MIILVADSTCLTAGSYPKRPASWERPGKPARIRVACGAARPLHKSEKYSLLEKLVRLRFLVGFLGEKAQFGWWPSEYCADVSDAFLNPVFARTKNLARYTGVVEAGRRVHDESIGVGQRVFHLFRLPAAMEQRLHESVASQARDDDIAAATGSTEAALSKLRELADGSIRTAEGPIAIGNSTDFANNDWLAAAAQCYLFAFENDQRCFPYITASA